LLKDRGFTITFVLREFAKPLPLGDLRIHGSKHPSHEEALSVSKWLKKLKKRAALVVAVGFVATVVNGICAW